MIVIFIPSHYYFIFNLTILFSMLNSASHFIFQIAIYNCVFCYYFLLFYYRNSILTNCLHNCYFHCLFLTKYSSFLSFARFIFISLFFIQSAFFICFYYLIFYLRCLLIRLYRIFLVLIYLFIQIPNLSLLCYSQILLCSNKPLI